MDEKYLVEKFSLDRVNPVNPGLYITSLISSPLPACKIMPPSSNFPVIIVTGANSGIGFGVCHRFLSHWLSCRDPVSDNVELNGLTLILACRNKQRAEAARTEFYVIADEQVRVAKLSPGYDGHAELFRRNLHIAIHTVDLGDIQSVFRFADEITKNYPYVSHLICNAGIARFSKIIWRLVCYQLLTDFIGAVSSPYYFLQHIGDVSRDGLGLVWQSNVFGHYALFRALEPMLVKYTATTGSRVIWMSSHEASSKFYDPRDWQLVKSGHSYECSKYQMNMISLYLDKEAVRCQREGIPAARHFIAYPGAVGTNIASALLGGGKPMWWFMYVSLYIARFLGSTCHTIDTFKAAISAVHLSIVCSACLPTSSAVASAVDPMKPVEVGTAYAARTNRRGREYVGMVRLSHSQEDEAQTKELLENCDRLVKTFCDIQGRASPSG